jgi:hypothetical protein
MECANGFQKFKISVVAGGNESTQVSPSKPGADGGKTGSMRGTTSTRRTTRAGEDDVD